MKSELPVWQLPVIQSNFSDTDWIHPKAKYHCFCEGKSLCGKYTQDTNYYETDIESVEIFKNPEIACKVCYNKWKKKCI